jgi:hypothetical protein
MVSGNPDYTQRVRIMQHIPSDIHALIEGLISGSFYADEGTESDAASYTAWQGAAVADDAGTKTVGANSLKFTVSAVDQNCATYRTPTSQFLWGNFVSIEVQTYRTAGQFATAGEGIYFVMQAVDFALYPNFPGVRAFIDLSADAAGVWTTHVLNKGDFVNFPGGLSAWQSIFLLSWWADKDTSTPSDYIHIDDCNIYAASPITKPCIVDADGHLQVDALSIAAGTNNIGDVDVASLPSIPAGTNNIGDVDVATLPSLAAGSNAIGTVEVTDVTKTVTFYSAAVNTLNETILISPGATEKVQVSYFSVVCYVDDTVVEIREQDTDTNRLFYAKMKAGAMFNANLIGSEYITSTVNKDLEIKCDQAGDCYVVIGYELV